MVDLDVEEPSVSQAKLLKAVGEFDGYLRANAGRIPNYGERRRAGEAISAQCSGPCHQPQTGLLFLVSGAPEISPETGHATENGVKQNLLTCEDALLWGW